MREVQGRSCQEGDAWWQVPGDERGVEGARRCRIDDAWREVPGAGFLGRFRIRGAGLGVAKREVQGGRFRERGAKRKVPEAAGEEMPGGVA